MVILRYHDSNFYTIFSEVAACFTEFDALGERRDAKSVELVVADEGLRHGHRAVAVAVGLGMLARISDVAQFKFQKFRKLDFKFPQCPGIIKFLHVHCEIFVHNFPLKICKIPTNFIKMIIK